MKAMNKFGFGVLLFAGLVMLSGCGSSAKKGTGAVVEDRSISPDEMSEIDSRRATTQGVRDGDAAGTTALGTEADGSLSVRTIYFEYDSSNIREEYRRVVEAHANALASRASQVITLEGHADERGSREYNLALAERRAQAVRRQMVLLGAAAGQIRVVSLGEERPANDGSNEEAYALNRRVEIKY